MIIVQASSGDRKPMSPVSVASSFRIPRWLLSIDISQELFQQLNPPKTLRGLSQILRAFRFRRLRVSKWFPWVGAGSRRTLVSATHRELSGRVSATVPGSQTLDVHFAKEDLVWLRRFLASPDSTSCGESDVLRSFAAEHGSRGALG